MRQCFIISLPRSGSTLLQRLLSAHPQVCTLGEPWLVLPFAYALRGQGIRAEYEHDVLAQGFQEFVSALPGKEDDYFREAGRMLGNLQARLAGPDKTYFLDKTPRYYLVLDELVRMFPQAKLIVLYRNPLAVTASIINTWKRGRFRLRTREIDVYEGPRRILDFVRAPRPNVLEIRYEDVVTGPETILKRITDFLELPALASAALPAADPVTASRLGDKTGIHRYREVSAAPAREWANSFASPVRRAWAKRYLQFIGEDNLQRMGYSSAQLSEEMRSAKLSWTLLGRDLWDFNWRVLPLSWGGPVSFERDTQDRSGNATYQWVTKFGR